MRSLQPKSLALLFLMATLLVILPVTVRAADEDDNGDEYEETARVVRVSFLHGEVSLRRAGSSEWERTTLNLPLVEGDTLATGRDARLEIQVDARNFIRVGADSVISVVTLRDEGIALSLTEGRATIRLARFDRDKEFFEVDAPRVTMAAEKQGTYRLDVRSDGNVRLTVRDDGRARIYSETSGFTLRDGRSAELVYEGTELGDWELTNAPPLDDWDRWIDQREYYLAQRLRYQERERYYDSNVWGAEELDAYGDWSYDNDYGWLWRPRTVVINNYYNWAPYRYGQWRWCQPYGWVWVGDEPWGWAPYHYGRWVFHNNNWCWAPRGYGYNYRRAWWRPALVVFVYVPSSYGERICWYPLTYGQRDPRSRYYGRQSDRLTSLNRNQVARLERSNPAYLRAVTSLPARDFGRVAARIQPASDDIARRAVAGEPVRGRLPVGPTGADAGANTAGTNGRTRTVARPGGLLAPARPLPDRSTGAAARTPGVPMDNVLRRARIFQGRDPRNASGTNNTGTNNTGTATGSIGVVERPTRPAGRRPQPPGDNGGGNNDDGQTSARPTRPTRPIPRVERPDPSPGDINTGGRQRDDGDVVQPVVRPTRPSRPTPSAPPSSSPGEETRPAPVERRPVERPRPAPRERETERPAPPPDRPAPSQPPPQQREAPPPQREAPPQRESPPPQRESPPPQREAPRPAEAPREERTAPARPQKDAAPAERDQK